MALFIQDKIIDVLRQNIKGLEKHLCGDVVSIVGPMLGGLPKALDNVLEELRKENMQNNNENDTLYVFLTTGGGDTNTVERLVAILRHFYNEVNFVVPDYAYSAGTILCMSGDDIYMDYSSVLGPIDPQVQNKDGKLVPVQSYLVKINDLLEKAQNGKISEAEFLILKDFDLAEISIYEDASKLTIELLKNWLVRYKFKNWIETETTKKEVTDKMKADRAQEIATALDDHTRWKTHGRPLHIDIFNDIGLKINDYSSDEELRTKVKEYHFMLTDFLDQNNLENFIHSRRSFL